MADERPRIEFPKQLKPSLWQLPGLWTTKKYLERVKETLMTDLANQPTALPSRKVTAATMGGVTASLLIWAASSFLGWQLSAEEAGLLVSAVALVMGYIVRERAAK